MIGQLISDVEALAASLRRGHAVNVNDQSSKDRAIDLTSRYFNEVRPLIVKSNGETDGQHAHDELWQQLLRLAHGSNSRRSYLKILSLLRAQLREFSISTIARPMASVKSGQPPTQEENLILDTLESLVPSAALSYRQGLYDLIDPERMSYRGTAAEFRESLRETLDHLAPDPDVEGQDWYKPEDDQTKPTMKQKVRYVLKLRERKKAQTISVEKTLGLVDELTGQVMRAVYDRASLASHVNQSRDEVKKVKRYVDTIFFDLLEIRL